ncbi:MAG TPA: hypothetical protein DHW77_09030 [Verrucomicrobiales bacterium]|nr:hypothetical protein [Verrucomicrobiales bacterium]
MGECILALGTLATILVACGVFYIGIGAILTNQLEESLYHLLIMLPLMLSLAITFDYVNSLMHEEYRRFRRSIARKKGVQKDIMHPDSKEVRNTPWEDDSSHTQ